jgi:hypothetical protein
MQQIVNPGSKLSYIGKLHKTLKNKRIILAFEGGFTQNLTKNILSMTENNMKGEDEMVKKKVFNVMVECLQNICKYADEVEKPISTVQDGIFMIGKNEEGYFLVSGNFINNKSIPELERKINEVNGLDKDGLKKLYKETLTTTELHEKGGAGLGLIDIARKSGQKLDYNFEQIDERISFYSLSTKISRTKELMPL